MSAFPNSVIAAYENYQNSKNAYAAVLNTDPSQVDGTREDDKHLSNHQRRLLRSRALLAPENRNTVDATGFLLVVVLVVLYPIFGTHHQFGWWPLLGLITAVFAAAAVFRKVARKHLWPELSDLLARRKASEDGRVDFQKAVVAGLNEAGLDVLESRPGFRYITNHGMATVATINGELSFLMNGKIVQQSYRDFLPN